MKNIQRITAFLLLLASLACTIPVASAASYTGTINAKKVFFRTKPKKESDYYCKLNTGDKVIVIGTNGDFYKVNYNKKTGYIMKKYVSLPSSATKELNPKNTYTSKYASVKSISKLGDAPNYAQQGSSGDSVEKLQQALKLKGFFSGRVDGIYGNYTVQAVKAFQKAKGLKQTGKADYATIMKLFGKVAYTTVENDPMMNGITKISQITVPSTTQKGSSGKDVIALQQALKIKGFFKAPIDGKYGDKTVEAVKAFQKSKKLYQDGVAGNGTIKALFGKNAANHSSNKTEKLDWFGYGKNIFYYATTFTVKDVYTGKTFKCQRRYSGNHLDAEPLTSHDTEIMKSVYDGNWSWARRPILVMYDGHVYAASMNGMPHGTCSITNNNFDGHFCIHFHNSRTNESNRVDESHQDCVERALKATW